MSLANPEHFILQLRAILRASLHGKVKIMYPMISDINEVIEANSILNTIKIYKYYREELFFLKTKYISKVIKFYKILS